MSVGRGMGGGRVLGRLATGSEIRDHKLDRGTARRVIAYGGPFKGLILLFLVSVTLGSALSVVPLLLFQRIIDDGVLAGDVRLIVVLSLVVAGMAVGSAALSIVERWCSARIGEGLIYSMRTQIFDHVLRMPIAFFSRSHTGKLVSRLHSDVNGAQQAFTSTLSSLVSNGVTLLLVLGSMLALSWPLTLGALVLLPIFMVPAQLVGRRLADLSRDRMQHQAEMSATMTERFSVSGALLVKLFGDHATENATFASQARAVADGGVKIAMTSRVFMTAMTFVGALATALFYGFGGYAAVEGQLTVGTLTALVALLARLYGPLIQLSSLRVDVMTALVSFERVFEVLDLKPLIVDAPDAKQVTGPPSVAFRDVWFTYPDAQQVSLESLEPAMAVGESANEPVLRGVTFEVSPGQTVALVGPSGAGKTTITHLLARLYDVDSGSVEIGGTDVRELALSSLQDEIGYVTQDAHLFHDTVGANLRYAKPSATEDELWAALEAAQIAGLVRRLPDGMATVVGERGYRLSGGERQRFAIARLLLKAPPILVLDEATAHLDSESEHLVQQALDNAREGRTSIVIAHRLSTVRHADQILVVESGRIVERGTHAELLESRGQYATLYFTQFSDD
ncbi:ABC transporter ATP-binding protein [Tessaracoccus sp. MC1865]|uniref:ABC transporter ATP-binding protein n=1 Tax=Tessaracoccus sp. MC1865 TaxID=2760310 RepID=UPI001601528F|nr:ABC transporter ATP-binding protein [Tessaracoccus sp. MC1865]MBB1482735.1 ABC transporter ATP-binding protein [Tessaracoccus sp. MC1865]QTO37817.1 ABC transporter ATP-binding protein [Tessaracoccus sp. MC1865]